MNFIPEQEKFTGEEVQDIFIEASGSQEEKLLALAETASDSRKWEIMEVLESVIWRKRLLGAPTDQLEEFLQLLEKEC